MVLADGPETFSHFAYLPLIEGHSSPVVQPGGFRYLGAFRLPAGVEEGLLGTGVQRRYRISDVAYDRANGLLYVLELYADEARPVIHVWRVA